MKTKLAGIFVSLFFLTSCGQIVGAVTGGQSIDFNSDVEAISVGIQKFEENSNQSANVQTFEAFKSISENNKIILDEIDAATENFLNSIEIASADLPTEDTTESPSKAKLTAWAQGYKSWVYFQKLNEKIGSECLNYPTEWMMCLISKLPETSQNEQTSTIKLKIAIQGIQEWRELAGR
jgi:hypothetical protein